MTRKIHYSLSSRILATAVIFTCVVFGAFLCVLGFDGSNIVELTQKSNSSVDYSVKLKDNNYFDKDNLPSGGKYIADLIDYFDVHFNYNDDFTQNITGNYSYKILATVSAKESKVNGGASYWSRSYELYDSNRFSFENVQNLNFSRDVKVDYDEYNKIFNDFKRQYGLSAAGELKISLVMNGALISGAVESGVPFNSEISMTIPLTQQTVEVGVDTTNPNGNKVLISSYKMSKSIIYTCRVLGICLLVAAAIVIIASIYFGRIREAGEEYEKNVKKLRSSFDGIIVNLKRAPNLSGIKVSEVNDFEELLDVYTSVHMPINYYSNKNSSTFLIVNENMAWKFVVRISDYQNN